MRSIGVVSVACVLAGCASSGPAATEPTKYEERTVDAMTLEFARPTAPAAQPTNVKEAYGYEFSDDPLAAGGWPSDFCPGPFVLTPSAAVEQVKDAFRHCLEAAFPEAPKEGTGQGKGSGGVTFHVHAKVENGVVVETTATDVYPPSAVDCVEEAFDTAHFASEGNVAFVLPMRLVWAAAPERVRP